MSNPAPGFARHPNHVVSIEPSPMRVTARVGDRVIADTQAALRVEESRHDPVWYFPADAVDPAVLIPSESTTYCPFKGHASYFSIDTGTERLEDAVWSYPAPFDECRPLQGYLAFYADRVRVESGEPAQRPT